MSQELDVLRPMPGGAGVHILAWTPLEEPRGTLRGFLDVHIPGFRLRLFSVTAHVKDGKRWCGLPARPWVDKNGALVKDEDTGKVKYQPVIGFDDDKVRWRFSDACIAALDDYAGGWDRQ